MRKNVILCWLTLILVATVAWSQASKGGGAEQAVMSLEQQWLQSQKTNNPDLIAPHLADKFVMTVTEGKVIDKAEYLKLSKARKYSSAEYKDLKVTVFGDTAIATGVYKGKGIASGKPFDETERFTDTWVKMPGGKWQCVATQETATKM
jgi:ketosteroid isomerase-like protein